jgi:hypothetical protein
LPPITTGPCAAIARNALSLSDIGFGGYPIGQPPNQMPKGYGTIAWRKSGNEEKAQTIVDPQDLRDMVKAALLEA